MAHHAGDYHRGAKLRFHALRKKLFASKDIDILVFDHPHGQPPTGPPGLMRRLNNEIDLRQRLEEIKLCVEQDAYMYVVSSTVVLAFKVA